MLKKIEENIAKYGQHIYLVASTRTPRFAYTIGLFPQLEFELILSGALFYSAADVKMVLNEISEQLRNSRDWRDKLFDCGRNGKFTLRLVDNSWASEMVLGALDYYKITAIKTLQVVPDNQHFTLDIPDMSQQFSPRREAVWQYLLDNRIWDFPILETSMAAIDINIYFGAAVTELTRWEIDYWEIFSKSGLDVSDEDRRIVPFTQLLAIDPTLKPAMSLPLGKGLWRQGTNQEWHEWG